jgi:hypothetical protein
MFQGTIRHIFSVLAITLVSASISRAQSTTSPDDLAIPARDAWHVAQQAGPSKGKLVVVTLDQPQHRKACDIQSFTSDKLVCSRAIGGTHTYLPQQVLALILPGDDDLRLRLVMGFNGGLAVAIWGTVVLAATCPACAVATGIVALMLFSGAGAILIGDDQPDRLLYLAPGQHLSGKLGYVQN